MKYHTAVALCIFLAVVAVAQGPSAVTAAPPPNPAQCLAILDNILSRVVLVATDKGQLGLTRSDQMNVSYAVQTLQGIVEANEQYQALLADGWQLVKAGKEKKQ